MKLLELLFMSPVNGPGFTAVEKCCSDDETLILFRCEIPLLSQTVFFDLQNALLPLAIRLLTSASMLAERESVLPGR